MTEAHDRMRYLLDQWVGQTSSAAEEEELFQLLTEQGQEKQIKGMLLQMMYADETTDQQDRERWQPLLQKVLDEGKVELKGKVHPIYSRRQGFTWKWVAAAAVLLLVAGGWWLTMKEQMKNDGGQAAITTKRDVPAPQSSRATITLSDGRQVVLDSALSGTLATQGNVKVVRNDKGEIVYHSAVNGPQTTVVYNTLYNPRGSKVVQLTLSDGSKVWLNNESSIKYPVAFNSTERRVEITGEAYFEVAKESSRKFKVKINEGTEVEVLGTHFNINAYKEEGIVKTTLLEGSVRVTLRQTQGDKGNNGVVLKPGQQARVVENDPSAALSVTTGVDVEQVMAWKNGMFEFAGNDLSSVMRQVSRWYDVEIVYEGESPVANFRGSISRQESIAGVLRMLELTKAVKFRVEGKKVFVSK
jgi:transmembrane sensor